MARNPQILWRRLDRPGHDACRIWEDGERQGVEGMAVWLDEAGPAHLQYLVTCDMAWATRSARVQGRVGAREVMISVHRSDLGEWRIGGEEIPELGGLQDIDLGFTPATNTLTIRRLRSSGRNEAEVGAAWLNPADWRLRLLPQSYRRTDAGWHYAAPRHGFEAVLAVDADGFITDYPGLWIKEDFDGYS
ncbi:putative glycolipid-binding domain-containing protein [Paracoccus sp. SCSIO 75233]|uniref:putative glycolipid-binding domain-containing protein n=1 Tax=Paracoccus sp. SCSIO 75233 TaxID=3017782 RepID=UPI0022F1115A|nr:putative glycolipid-binding domain-containing protein [Paracoccus sp. SCSIO 75233]WBU54602.1 putative glycolipid-binding domain-containing protein [Paracoccus sp. SCSIO 75233]